MCKRNVQRGYYGVADIHRYCLHRAITAAYDSVYVSMCVCGGGARRATIESPAPHRLGGTNNREEMRYHIQGSGSYSSPALAGAKELPRDDAACEQ